MKRSWCIQLQRGIRRCVSLFFLSTTCSSAVRHRRALYCLSLRTSKDRILFVMCVHRSDCTYKNRCLQVNRIYRNGIGGINYVLCTHYFVRSFWESSLCEKCAKLFRFLRYGIYAFVCESFKNRFHNISVLYQCFVIVVYMFCILKSIQAGRKKLIENVYGSL